MDGLIYSPLWENSTSPTPAPNVHDAPFTCKIYQLLVVSIYTQF